MDIQEMEKIEEALRKREISYAEASEKSIVQLQNLGKL